MMQTKGSMHLVPSPIKIQAIRVPHFYNPPHSTKPGTTGVGGGSSLGRVEVGWEMVSARQTNLSTPHSRTELVWEGVGNKVKSVSRSV